MDDLYVALQRTNEIVEGLADVLRESRSGNTQSIQFQANIGGWAVALAVIFAIGSCAVTVACMFAFMTIENRSYSHMDNQIDQLRAWNDVHSKEIARLQAQLQEKK